ncbi:MAG: hypothetical protein QOJ09_2019, partial [Actinomycetota bacterium]|nr:hypothetical protein [Actinomycetota bacterium]
MDFDLSDDQLALRSAARDVLADLAHPRQADGFEDGLWKAMVAQGWLGVELPEADGGLGMGAVETAVLLEELGRHVAPVPYLQTVLALGALQRAGRADWVERLVTGEAIGTVAARPGALTIGAPLADVAVVIDGADGVLLVDLAGRRPAREPAMDLTRPVGWLPNEGGERIGGPDDAVALLDRAAAGHAAEMLGGADRVLGMAVEYAKQRRQFGQPIGSFQAVKHRCADMLVDVEGMRSAVYYAAWSI